MKKTFKVWFVAGSGGAQGPYKSLDEASVIARDLILFDPSVECVTMERDLRGGFQVTGVEIVSRAQWGTATAAQAGIRGRSERPATVDPYRRGRFRK